MKDWLATLIAQVEGGAPVVRVIVARVRGSAPREEGTCMLVTAGAVLGTIGGGHLEHVGIATARGMLAPSSSAIRTDRYSLGASLGQCCGGIVELAFVRYDAADLEFLAQARAARGPRVRLATRLDAGPGPKIQRLLQEGDRAARGAEAGELVEALAMDLTPLAIFGAGHVGRALVSVLADLPFAITWIDSREGVFPAATPDDIACRECADPAAEAAALPGTAWALVMTHSHDEDYAICEALLRSGGDGWIGLIGSQPKATRFRQRLARRGFDAATIARIASPIGIGGIASKAPAAIAVGVAAQLLRLREAAEAAAGQARTA